LKKKTILEKVSGSKSRIEPTDQATLDGRTADKAIRLCPVCKLCYDTKYYKDYADMGKVTYYEDFPKYGKEKVVCPECS
jgi:hypothetical protein